MGYTVQDLLEDLKTGPVQSSFIHLATYQIQAGFKHSKIEKQVRGEITNAAQYSHCAAKKRGEWMETTENRSIFTCLFCHIKGKNYRIFFKF